MTQAFTERNKISGITLIAACDENPTGLGSLIAATANTLTWTAPDDTVGTAVEIANGEQKIIHSHTTTYYIIVSRTSATDLSGTETIVIEGGQDTQERLDEVDAAISLALKAQSAGQGDGSHISIANLADLRIYRNELAKKLAYENGTAARIYSADLRGHF